MDHSARRRATTTGNNSASRTPFRNLRASPWRRGGGMNEKSLTDTVRVLVDPSTTSFDKRAAGAIEERALSPFRNQSDSSGRASTSPWRNHTHGMDRGPKQELHESEISIFKQLCLDKYDETAAIEILLDSTESNIPELYTASSESTDHGSGNPSRKKAGSVEGKKKFLDRLFFKSPRKSSSNRSESSHSDFLDSSKENNLSWSHSSNPSDEPSNPTPPSSIPRTRTNVEKEIPVITKVSWSIPAKNARGEGTPNRTRSILDDVREGSDTVSNISSLSGTRTSSLITPVTFDRHESLGFESIKDIRKCLKEMERQLGQATNKGQRVSRQKVMRALFTVADSLEDDDDTDFLKDELSTAMKMELEAAIQPVVNKPLKVASTDYDDKSELTTSDDEDFTLDSGTFKDVSGDREVNESAFNIVSSVGNFFGVSTQDQQTVEEVLDDLLWTEFVSSRQQNSNHSRSGTNKLSAKGQKTTLHVEEYGRSKEKESATRQYSGSRTRSWWRSHPSKEEDEYSSSSSEDEFPSYLPTSITVKQRYLKHTNFENVSSRSNSNPQYKVKLVDTESRLGYEMDNNSKRSPVL
eukprot:jgi/Psemu1/34489/gm1.34489_g